MALKSLVFNSKGDCLLNSLRRYCGSGVLVPQQNLTIAKIPAGSATSPGRATPIPIQGPADASTEVYSFNGEQGVTNQGIGNYSASGLDAVMRGVGTNFLSQLQAGDQVFGTNGDVFNILSVQSDTIATATGNILLAASAGYFAVTTINRTSGETTFVKIQDQAWRRYLMNRDVPAIHVFGGENIAGLNNKPLFLKESLLLETDQTLLLEFLNYDTAPASFAPIAEGRKWQYNAMKYKEVYNFISDLRQRKQYAQPYWLTLDKGWSTMAAPANTQTTELLTCTGDITLVLFNCYAQAFDSNSSFDVSSLVTVQFQDAKTMRSIQSQPLPLNLAGGTARNPFRLPSPWIVEPQTQIKANFVNNSGAAVKIYLTFQGVAIYTGSSWHGSTLTNQRLKEEESRMYEAMSTPQIRKADVQ